MAEADRNIVMEEYRWIVEIAVGAVTSLAGWLVGRRQRNNSFLGDLQASINALAAKNAEQMNEILKLREEVISLRSENYAQSKKIDAQSDEITALRRENSQLKEQIDSLQQQLSGIKTITRKQNA